MPRPLLALATLLTALALPALPALAAPSAQSAKPAPAPSPPPKASPAPLAAPATQAPKPAPEEPGWKAVPDLHLSVGTGVCAAASSATTTNDNPCWLQLGVAPGVRLGRLELGLVYEGRELLKWITFGLVRPPSVTVVGLSAGWVHEPSERWRLSAAAEAGWRRYMDFAGSGVSDRTGTADTTYVGGTGRAALGLRPESGRADRLEVSVSVRSDLGKAHATVDGVDWSAGGWSFVMGLGLVSEW